MTAKHATVTVGKPRTVQRTAALLRFPVQRRFLRARVAAAFRQANGRDERNAYAVTKEWYRSSGSEWTRGLSEGGR
jgi:hypothetical protein